MSLEGSTEIPVNLFGVPLDLVEPSRLEKPPAWTGHVPFAFWLVTAARPRVIVELGTHTGTSYCAMCEAVQRHALDTACFAVDTWQGDEHAGFYDDAVYKELRQYHDPRFGAFSTLLRSTFDDALERFEAGSVDLLHIDGLHTYEAVRHDFETWRGKLSERAIVLFHDTAVRSGGFGVWRLWEELQERHPSFTFLHSYGLGVLGVGRLLPKPVRQLMEANDTPEHAAEIRQLFARLGDSLHRRLIIDEARVTIEQKDIRIGSLTAEVEYLTRLLSEHETAVAGLQTEHDAAIAALQTEHDAAIAALQTEHDAAIAALQNMLTNSEQAGRRALEAGHRAEHELEAVIGSVSWRLTAPGRAAKQQLRDIARVSRSALERNVRRRVRLGPLVPPPLFDATFYREGCPNLRNAKKLKLWVHFCRHGVLERRNPNPLFDTGWYLDMNPDVQRAGINPLLHYWRDGAREGRDPHPLFSTSWYLQQNPDVAASGLNPLLHFLQSGGHEGRAPHPAFDAKAYLAQNADVAASGMAPLLHYWLYGRHEGRSTSPAVPGYAIPPEKAKDYTPAFRQENYHAWINAVERPGRADLADLRRRLAALVWTPTFSVIMPTYNSDLRLLSTAIDSVRHQIYPYWEICICDDASADPRLRSFLNAQADNDSRIRVIFREQNGHISAASNSAIEVATGEFLCFVDHDDEIPEHAMLLVAEELNRHLDANLVYTDQDKIDVDGLRSDPYFKPQFDPDLLRSQNYIDHLATFRTSLVRKLGGLRLGFEGSQDYDLVLRVVDASRPEQIRHVPHVLYHWRAVPGSIAHATDAKSYAPERSRIALREHLARNGVDAQVLAPFPELSIHRVKYSLPERRPLVSVIVPTRDEATMLRTCVDSVLIGTDYSPIELIIVDNQSCEQETFDLFHELGHDERVRIIHYDRPFNYSALNNIAVADAQGELVCFINNDVHSINADWLEEMVSHALRPEIGAVGARLLYASGHVQHAGVIAGYRGLFGHAFRYMARHDLGPWARAQLIQNYLAVTAACLVVQRSIFDEVGGFNEADLAVVFNDVDLCLRIHEAGYRNLFTPYAELFHLESVTRKLHAYEAENRYMQQHWAKWIKQDPFFNPNLDTSSEAFILPTVASRTSGNGRDA